MARPSWRVTTNESFPEESLVKGKGQQHFVGREDDTWVLRQDSLVRTLRSHISLWPDLQNPEPSFFLHSHSTGTNWAQWAGYFLWCLCGRCANPVDLALSSLNIVHHTEFLSGHVSFFSLCHFFSGENVPQFFIHLPCSYSASHPLPTSCPVPGPNLCGRYKV